MANEFLTKPKEYNKHGLNIRLFTEKVKDQLGQDTYAVAKAFSLYPTIKWIARQIPSTKAFDNVVAADVDYVSNNMKHLQKALLAVGGSDVRLHLQRREAFIQNCFVLTYILERETDKLAKEKRGNQMIQALVDTYGVEVDSHCDEELTKFRATQLCGKAFGLIAKTSGDRLSEILERLTKKPPAESDEDEHLCHNVGCLIREYRKLVWNTKASSLQARILKCRTEEELKSISTTPDAYQSSYVLCEYVKLIRAAANALDSYPGENRYGDIIRSLLDDKDTTDATVAMKLLMSDRTYARQKKAAYVLFGTLLWGCDAANINELLL